MDTFYGPVSVLIMKRFDSTQLLIWGTQGVATTPFCAGTWALTPGQVWADP